MSSPTPKRQQLHEKKRAKHRAWVKKVGINSKAYKARQERIKKRHEKKS